MMSDDENIQNDNNFKLKIAYPYNVLNRTATGLHKVGDSED